MGISRGFVSFKLLSLLLSASFLYIYIYKERERNWEERNREEERRGKEKISRSEISQACDAFNENALTMWRPISPRVSSPVSRASA